MTISDLRGFNATMYDLEWLLHDLNKAMKGVHTLQAGFVQVNQNLVVQPGLSYGGDKMSGLGKEASFEAMLEHFTKKKTILINRG